MPHKYEREIEEILRNMELAEPRRGVGERVQASQRPTTRARLRGPSMNFRLTSSESLLLVGVLLTLVGMCFAFYYGNLANPVSGLFGVAAFAAVIGGLVLGWISGRRPVYPPSWRSAGSSAGSTSKVVEMRPRRRGPISELVTRIRILRLKMRYWRSRNR